jgi:hypothetical protein
MGFFIEACFRFAIYHFDGKITEVLKLLLQQDAKPTNEHDLIPVSVRLAPEVYEGLQRLHSRTGAASASAAAPPETPLNFGDDTSAQESGSSSSSSSHPQAEDM